MEKPCPTSAISHTDKTARIAGRALQLINEIALLNIQCISKYKIAYLLATLEITVIKALTQNDPKMCCPNKND